MAIKTNAVLPIVLGGILLSLCDRSVGSLNVDELHSINYGIDLLNEPVMKNEDNTDGSVLLKSKYGQEYQCSFPNQLEQDRQKEEGEKAALEKGILELLKPMERGPCLFKTKGWWTYEFCFEKYIKQYHVEEGVVKGEQVTLGVYSHDFDWDNETNRDQRVKSRSGLSRYHSQYYVNGSNCDLTRQPRKTEVRFACEAGGNDFIARIDEPETCTYIVTIHTRLICQHPYLKPLAQPKPVPITCSPLLSPQQFQQYHSRDAEIKRIKAEIEQQSQRLKMISSQLDSGSKTPASSEHDQSAESLEGMEGVSLSVQDYIEDSAGEEVNVRTRFAVIKNIDDLHKFMEQPPKISDTESGSQDSVDSASSSGQSEEKEEAADGSKHLKEPDPKVKTDSQPGEPIVDETAVGDQAVEEEKKDDEEDVEKYINEGAEDLENAVKVQDDQFDQEDMLDSMKQELNQLKKTENMLGDSPDTEKKAAIKQLSESLSKLLNRLETSQKKIDAVDKKIEDIVDKMNAKEDSADADADATEPASAASSPEGPDASNLEDRVRVKIRKLPQSEMAARRETDTPGLSDAQRDNLERSVKEELSKAGLDTKNQRIHVKIVTAGYIDKDDDSIHILSGEDTAAFQNMIVAILGGSGEASREQSRQEQMEKNYRFIYGGQAASPVSEMRESGMEAAESESDAQMPSRREDSTVIEEREE